MEECSLEQRAVSLFWFASSFIWPAYRRLEFSTWVPWGRIPLGSSVETAKELLTREWAKSFAVVQLSDSSCAGILQHSCNSSGMQPSPQCVWTFSDLTRVISDCMWPFFLLESRDSIVAGRTEMDCQSICLMLFCMPGHRIEQWFDTELVWAQAAWCSVNARSAVIPKCFRVLDSTIYSLQTFWFIEVGGVSEHVLHYVPHFWFVLVSLHCSQQTTGVVAVLAFTSVCSSSSKMVFFIVWWLYDIAPRMRKRPRTRCVVVASVSTG